MSRPTAGLADDSRRATVVAQGAAGAFFVVAIVHLTSLLIGWNRAADVTMGLLMPPLAIFLATVVTSSHPRRANRVVVALLAALFFCWLGDLADDIAVKLVAFAIAHAAYCVAWWPWRRSSLAGRRRTRLPAVGMYAVVALVMIVVLAGHVGGLIGPIVVYAVLLSAMALLASSTGPRAALGGAVFVVSDSLLAWHVFVSPLPLGDVWVMSTYLCAQWLVVSGSRRWLVLRSGVVRATG